MTGIGTFMAHIEEFAAEVHETAEAHGFGGYTDEKYLLLMHSEISEITEALRHGNPKSEHIPDFSHVEEELMDIIIRVLDFAKRKGYEIARPLIAKAAFNKTRPHKHGKKW